MKSLLTLFGGGAIINVLKRTPATIKFPLFFGAGMFAMAELNHEVNHSWFSAQIFGGQAAQGVAQIADPIKTRQDIQAGLPVTGAASLVAVQYESGAADARQKTITADVMDLSEAEMLAKKRRGEKLNSAQELRLLEMQVKRKELGIRAAEEEIKLAEASAARSKAEADIAISRMISGTFEDGGSPVSEVANRALTRAGLPRTTPHDLAERALSTDALLPSAFRSQKPAKPAPSAGDTVRNLEASDALSPFKPTAPAKPAPARAKRPDFENLTDRSWRATSSLPEVRAGR